MSWLHALILGVVQGITEFFPVSSSAHLKALKTFFNLPAGEETVIFDLFCHLGTLLALTFYFRKEILELIREPRQFLPFIAALAPLVPAYFLMKPFRDALSRPELLGFCMIGTAFILFAASLLRKQEKPLIMKDAVWIGALQALALVPGISRSAATIGTGLWRGLSTAEAVRFSFLLSVPAVAGGTLLELLKVKSPLAGTAVPMVHCWIGFGAAAIVGLAAVRFAIPLLQRGVLRPFALYCLIAGILLSLYL